MALIIEMIKNIIFPYEKQAIRKETKKRMFEIKIDKAHPNLSAIIPVGNSNISTVIADKELMYAIHGRVTPLEKY